MDRLHDHCFSSQKEGNTDSEVNLDDFSPPTYECMTCGCVLIEDPGEDDSCGGRLIEDAGKDEA